MNKNNINYRKKELEISAIEITSDRLQCMKPDDGRRCKTKNNNDNNDRAYINPTARAGFRFVFLLTRSVLPIE